MKAWLIAIFTIVFISAGTFLYVMYSSAMNPLQDREEEAIAFAEEHISFHSVSSVNRYHGARSYQVIDALNEEDEPIFIWVEERFTVNEPRIYDEFETEVEEEEEEPRRIIIRRQDSGISREEVENHIQNELTISRLNSIRLGMIGRTPVYEVNYISEDGRQSYYYLTFEEGRYIRHYQF